MRGTEDEERGREDVRVEGRGRDDGDRAEVLGGMPGAGVEQVPDAHAADVAAALGVARGRGRCVFETQRNGRTVAMPRIGDRDRPGGARSVAAAGHHLAPEVEHRARRAGGLELPGGPIERVALSPGAFFDPGGWRRASPRPAGTRRSGIARSPSPTGRPRAARRTGCARRRAGPRRARAARRPDRRRRRFAPTIRTPPPEGHRARRSSGTSIPAGAASSRASGLSRQVVRRSSTRWISRMAPSDAASARSRVGATTATCKSVPMTDTRRSASVSPSERVAESDIPSPNPKRTRAPRVSQPPTPRASSRCRAFRIRRSSAWIEIQSQSRRPDDNARPPGSSRGRIGIVSASDRTGIEKPEA